MLKEITAEEAAKRLGRATSSFQNAVQRGIFTLSPRSNRRRHLVYEDQVKLFEGKEMSLTALSTEEYARWLQIDTQAQAIKPYSAAELRGALELMRRILAGEYEIKRRRSNGTENMLRPLADRGSRERAATLLQALEAAMRERDYEKIRLLQRELIEPVHSNQTVLLNVGFYVLALLDEYGLLFEPGVFDSFTEYENVLAS